MIAGKSTTSLKPSRKNFQTAAFHASPLPLTLTLTTRLTTPTTTPINQRPRHRQPQCTCNAQPTSRPPNQALLRMAALIAAAQLLTHAPGALQPTQAATEQNAPLVQEEQAATQTEIDTQEQTEAHLREQTQRNTRVTGKASQKFTKARRVAETGDYAAALQAYTELIAEVPNFAPGYSNRANIHVAMKEFDKAVTDYTRAIQLAPLDGDAWVVYVNRGTVRLALGQDPNAVLQDFNTAFERKGADVLILSNRAAVYEALGKWDSAIRDYQRALKGNDVQPFWLRYALVLFERGKMQECLAILKRVASRFEVDDVKAALAVVYFEGGDIAGAETQWSAMERPRLFESRAALLERKWPPRAIDGMAHFRSLKE